MDVTGEGLHLAQYALIRTKPTELRDISGNYLVVAVIVNINKIILDRQNVKRVISFLFRGIVPQKFASVA